MPGESGRAGLRTAPVAAGWEALFDGLDSKQVNLDDCFPEPEEMEPVVREAFADIDPSGEVGEECWSDYSKKIERWRGCRPQFERFLENGPRYRDELKELVATPGATTAYGPSSSTVRTIAGP